MTIKASYGALTRALPAPGTILADVIVNTPSQGFATIDQIAERVGHHQRSVPALIPIAHARGLVERLYASKRPGQGYRLTAAGRLAKLALTAGD